MLLLALTSLLIPSLGVQAPVRAAASEGVIIDVKSPTVIGFFPPFTQEEEKADDGGISEGLAHVGFALDDIAKCYANEAAVYRLEQTRVVTLRAKGRARRINIPKDWQHAVGIILVMPGRAPRVVYASAGPSSLQYLAPEAASKYCGAAACSTR